MGKINIKSPDNNIEVNFMNKENNQENGIFYNVLFKGKNILFDSRLSLDFDDLKPMMTDFEIINTDFTSKRDEWEPVYGEKDVIPDNYNQVKILLQEKTVAKIKLIISFRVYNEGIAFRYELPQQNYFEKFTITSECSEFSLPSDCIAYEEHGTEGKYLKSKIEKIEDGCERPLTIEYNNGLYVSIHEARVNNYSQMLLTRISRKKNTLQTFLRGKVTGETSFFTPWRVIIIGEKPGDLLENNHVILNLNLPCVLDDTSWIKPGKAIREVSLSTEGGKACVDFAVEHNLQYVEFDAGWYDDEEFAEEADARNVNKNKDLDLKEVIEYAAVRGIGVFLYVNHKVLEKQLDEILPIYKEWGIKGLKFGFVEVGPQEWTRWLLKAVRKCAVYELMVDIHDAYRPTGFSRTYPNLLTQEGIRGNEHMPTASHNTTLSFTRFPAGAGDYTICYYSDRIKPTHAHQLAMAVIVYSPLQFVFWYDKPSDYRGEPEVEFFEEIPSVWDETRVLQGEIGKYVVIARRSNNDWFLGIITNEQERELTVNLGFLHENREYNAYIYHDTQKTKENRTGVEIKEKQVTSSTSLKANLMARGGQAVRIVADR